MEALEPPKHPTTSGYHHPSTAAGFGLDGWWGPTEIRQEKHRYRRARARTCPACDNSRTLMLVSSSPMSQRASAISTPAMWFMEISREYVIISDIILPIY